jgi:hypothetical protein
MRYAEANPKASSTPKMLSVRPITTFAPTCNERAKHNFASCKQERDRRAVVAARTAQLARRR